MQMTYRKAIIILDRLVTAERIEVDREELREAVKAAQKALNIVADLPPNHGRLIDAEKLWEAMGQAFENDRHWVNFFGIVDEAPTIIEAEVSE